MTAVIISGSTYVALGSSFAAGPGIGPVVGRRAGRSGRNYPHQVAAALSLRLVDVTRSGATTGDVLRPKGAVPAQVDAVTPDAKLVTITVGGNDVGYIGGLFRVSVLGRLRFLPERLRRGRDVTRARWDALAASLVEIVRTVRQRAPAARILLVDYLTVVGPDARRCRELPLDDADIERVRATGDELCAAFRAAAERSGAHLVLASAASVHHGVGSALPWVTGFHWGGPAPYHPTAAGMTAVAELVLDHVRSSTGDDG
jgi:lysophospholipase L1-like esterase